MKSQKNISNQKEEKVLLNFLKETKQGKYAKIDEGSLDYVRIKQEREVIDSCSEMYYYSFS